MRNKPMQKLLALVLTLALCLGLTAVLFAAAAEEASDAGITRIAYPMETAPQEGDMVLIYFDKDGTAFSSIGEETKYGTQLLPVAVETNNNVVYAGEDAAVFTVAYDADHDGLMFLCDGQYLTSTAADDLQLTDAADAEGGSAWKLEATDGGWLLDNAGPSDQFLEFYGGFTTYHYEAQSVLNYTFNFYQVIPAAEKLAGLPADGDRVVLWYNDSDLLVTGDINLDQRMVGMESAVTGTLLPVFDGAAVFDVVYNSDHDTYTFVADGLYLTSTDANVIGLTEQDASGCSEWTLETAQDGWLLRNAGALYSEQPIYFEFYKTGFTTYTYYESSAAAYTFNFYAFNGYAPQPPSNNLEQEMPAGLTAVAPVDASNNTGMITGTTADMEYKLTADETWMPCAASSTVRLLPGDYEVRYAEKEGFNASPSALLTVAYFADSEYLITDLTLQIGADETQMNFNWYASQSDTAQVQMAVQTDAAAAFQEDNAVTFDGETMEAGSFTANKVTVAGLEPNQTYAYRVGNGTDFSAVYTFTTQDTQAFTAILVGDPQIGCSGSIASDLGGWQQTLSQALTAVPHASFILSGGDQVETALSQQQYRALFNPDALVSVPLVPSIGNHDDNTLYQTHYNSPNLSAEYGITDAGSDYWFTYGDTLFMMLNSNNLSAFSHETFVKDAIEQAGEGIAWKVVVFHHSIYSSATHSADADILARRNDFYPFIDKYGIDVVLMAHDHVYSRSYQMLGGIPQTEQTVDADGHVVNPTGTLYVTLNSSTGSKYYDLIEMDTNYRAMRWQGYEPSYSKLEIAGDMLTISTYTSADNTLIDTYSIVKTDAE